MRRKLLRIFLLTLLLASCSSFAPRFINHEKPNISLDFAAFEKAGCPSAKGGVRNCKKDSPLYALGCDALIEPDDVLATLKPAYPIMLCLTFRDGILFDEIIPIQKSLQEKCDSTPDKVCPGDAEFISETVQASCARTHSTACDRYREVLQERCSSEPAKVCDPFEGPYKVRTEVEDKILHVDLDATGTYTYETEGDYFFSWGGLQSALFRYVTFQDNLYVLIETEEELRKVFAPLNTADEALAYAEAVTGLQGLYDLKLDSRYEYFVDVVEDTHVDPVADGYLVHLYDKKVVGCGPHPTYQVTFHVTPEGIVRPQEVKQIFKNLAEDGMCVD